MIEWIWPWMFALLPLPLLIRYLMPPARHEQAALTVPNIHTFQIKEVAGATGDGGQIPWRAILLVLAWVGLVSASARPQWIGDAISLPTTGRDLMLAVDISGSMGTEDMQLGGQLVDRLVVVKAVVSQFVEARQGDRVGLILFGTNAYVQAPLTFDLTSVNRLLIEAPVGIAGGKTAIGDAIGLAVKRLKQRPESQRVLILLTDGASNVGAVAPRKAAELAQLENVTIYTIGVGADEMRMPSVFGALGSRIVNPSVELDEDTLKAIADLTNGRYFRAQNTEKLAEIYQLIEELEPIEQDPETYRPVVALYFWPLTFAWITLCVLLVAPPRLVSV
ncbi:MAG: VWA domain-containing protein [Proteobacteria bacterium]|nr:VWA domain-containing protein [Pseudomonadota bacterium]